RDEWKKYVDAITAPGTAPDAKFCGPSATPGKASWARDFISDFGKSGKIAFISQHDYPGGAGNKATNVVAARDKMLSAAWLKNYKNSTIRLRPMHCPTACPIASKRQIIFTTGVRKT